VAVEVNTRHPIDPEGWVSVAINGYPGVRRYLHFRGRVGARMVRVVAATEDGLRDTWTDSVVVQDCRRQPFHDVRSRFNPYRPHTVDLTVRTHKSPSPNRGVYLWDFGDGTADTTALPFVSHFYGDHIDGSRPYEQFVVSVTDSDRELTTRHAVTLRSVYYDNRKRGLIQPRVNTSGRLERWGRWLSGRYSIQNLEA
jgi:hypothetical protein